MKNVTIIICAIWILVGELAPAQAQDVYNFYFQKAPGPETVTQGGKNDETGTDETTEESESEVLGAKGLEKEPENLDAKKSTPPGPAGSQVETTIPQVSSKALNYSKWSIYLGFGSSRSLAYDSYRTIVGGDYNFSKYGGLDGQILFGRRAENDKNGYRRDVASPEISLGAHLTPLRLTLFEWDLMEYSLLAGIMSTRNVSANSTVVPYIGLGLGLNFTKNISLVAQFKSGSGSFQGWGALAYRF